MSEQNTALILGAGSDIAKAVARKFARQRYHIQLAGRNIEQMERLQKDLIARYEATVDCLLFDAQDFDSHPSFVSSLPALPDVVIYTAGVMSEQNDARGSWGLSQNMIDVNFSGAVSILNQFAALFEEKKSGCIVGISSVAGERGKGSNYIYGSTKAALTAYLSGLRNELSKKDVRVITIKPGFVYTKMTQHLNLPARLTARPTAVADAIYGAVMKKKDVIYVKPVWKWIMLVIKMIPEPLFKKTAL